MGGEGVAAPGQSSDPATLTIPPEGQPDGVIFQPTQIDNDALARQKILEGGYGVAGAHHSSAFFTIETESSEPNNQYSVYLNLRSAALRPRVFLSRIEGDKEARPQRVRGFRANAYIDQITGEDGSLRARRKARRELFRKIRGANGVEDSAKINAELAMRAMVKELNKNISPALKEVNSNEGLSVEEIEKLIQSREQTAQKLLELLGFATLYKDEFETTEGIDQHIERALAALIEVFNSLSLSKDNLGWDKALLVANFKLAASLSDSPNFYNATFQTLGDLLNRFKNQGADPELRKLAYEVYLATAESIPESAALAKQIQKEKNLGKALELSAQIGRIQLEVERDPLNLSLQGHVELSAELHFMKNDSSTLELAGEAGKKQLNELFESTDQSLWHRMRTGFLNGTFDKDELFLATNLCLPALSRRYPKYPILKDPVGFINDVKERGNAKSKTELAKDAIKFIEEERRFTKAVVSSARSILKQKQAEGDLFYTEQKENFRKAIKLIEATDKKARRAVKKLNKIINKKY